MFMSKAKIPEKTVNYEYKFQELEQKVDKLRQDFNEVRTKYNTWLEEKELFVQELRNKMQRKIEAMSRKEDQIDAYKQAYKRKLLGIKEQKGINRDDALE